MSEIKTLEKLRNTIVTYAADCDERWMLAACDEIEAEIAERYMLLPVDADGVPWHIGDMTENRNVVNGIAFDRHGAHFISTLNDIDPNIHTHFKPRTLTDILADLFERKMSVTDAEHEISELLGGDAE